MDPAIAPPQSNRAALSLFRPYWETHRNALAKHSRRTFADLRRTTTSARGRCLYSPYFAAIHELINPRRGKFARKVSCATSFLITVHLLLQDVFMLTIFVRLLLLAMFRSCLGFHVASLLRSLSIVRSMRCYSLH